MFCFPGQSASTYPCPSLWRRCSAPVFAWDNTPMPPTASILVPSYIPHELHIAPIVNPQLAHYRSPLHPHIDWDAAASPLLAIQRIGPLARPITENHQLEQHATSPPVNSLMLAFSGPTAIRLAPWSAIYIARTDHLPLTVGDVLHAIHIHLRRPLTWDEIRGMPGDVWERVMQAFNRRVRAAAGNGDQRQYVMERLDFLDGQTLFDGIQLVAGEFQLSLL
ncbi:hypothetical protein C8R44DRAFT_212283 [Mycena epipterygia]|nr:hypothetical protein C8R44DRAFT_212283 [Mycena epipterygia]